ncbi:glmZ(sRNA)-inactivating NTPase [Corynebacterium kalinowskii]|uniref:GlmZ(SRNA)-inactivating NTPase n=1 Tax=Corynebacterium kalinowskii TaxID=2675216 RepID=A0A6B8VD40_9CORY|nr:RNase adapter RapZ [Corynebacterium kalinowskii]QGU02083.1 glmZ(sRNA)-inactivating NTPase [Corynebacterium kalinowskii]
MTENGIVVTPEDDSALTRAAVVSTVSDKISGDAPVLITGMSGAGLNSAARVLEDMGWYVAQNLPAKLVLQMVEMCSTEDSPVDRLALVSDVRSRPFNGNLVQVIDELDARGHRPIILFMEARDDILIRRFDSVRRTHPMQGPDTLQHGITRERRTMFEVKEQADIVIDTSDLSVHDLRRAIEFSFESVTSNKTHVTLQSFGFKRGAPHDTDLILDVRFLPNPYWVGDLRKFRGVDKPVSDYVLAQKAAREFIDSFVEMFNTMIAGYRREGKRFVTVSIGCTGGHHRSVAMAEEIGRILSENSELEVAVIHRDIKLS